MKKTFLTLLGGMLLSLSIHAQVTFTVTGGSSFNSGAEGCENAMDANLSTKWFASGNDNHLLFEASEKIQLTGYTFVTANDNFKYGRVPKEWEIFGSNESAAATDINHSSWTSIQYLRGDNVMQHVDFTPYYYAINTASTAYKYFKLKVVYGDTGNFQISEFIPSYTPQYVPNYVAVDGLGTGNEGYDKLFDCNPYSKWCTTSRIGEGRMYWMMFKTDEPVAVAKYRFATANDADNRDPKSWTLYGLNATSDPNRADPRWEAIDTKTDQTFPSERKTWCSEFEVSNEEAKAKSYNYFLLKITDTRGGGNSDTQFSEFRLNDKVGGYTAIGGSNNYNNDTEIWSKAFDNNVDTKWGTNDRIDNKIYWTIFRTNSAKSIEGYSITSANDDNSRDPRSWVLYGMNSDSQPDRTDSRWTLVDQRVRVANFPTDRMSEVHYAVSPASAEYNYFLLEIDELRGGDQALMQFSEFKLDGIEDKTEDCLIQYFGDLTAQDRTSPIRGSNGIVYKAANSAYFSFGPANSEPVSINGYSIRTANYGESYNNASRPKSWTLYGSNDGANPNSDISHWEAIHSVTDDTVIPADNLAVGYFHLNEPSKPYKYFKLDITDSYGSNLVCFCDFSLFYRRGDQMNYLTINDGTSPVFNGNVKVANLNYSRSVDADKYGTVCLPFALTGNSDVKYYVLRNVVNGDMVFDEVETLEPNQPALFHTSAATTIGISGEAIVEARPERVERTATESDAWKTVGITKTVTLNSDDYATDKVYYVSGNEVYQSTGTVDVNALRAVFVGPDVLESGAKLGITLGDTNGVDSIETLFPTVSTKIYNAVGQYVGNDARLLNSGLYIINGKTILLKK